MSHKILVVDDDPTVVKLIESILKSKDYEVLTAEDGLDALVKIKNENPDLVILDIVMPEINGYDVCCELRFNKDYEKIPILIVTETEQEIDDAIGERVNIGYIQKPIESEAILSKLKHLLKTE